MSERASVQCGNPRHPDGPWHPATGLSLSWVEQVRFEMAPRPQCQIDDLKRIRDLFTEGRTLADYGRSALAGQVLDSTSHPSTGDAR